MEGINRGSVYHGEVRQSPGTYLYVVSAKIIKPEEPEKREAVLGGIIDLGDSFFHPSPDKCERELFERERGKLISLTLEEINDLFLFSFPHKVMHFTQDNSQISLRFFLEQSKHKKRWFEWLRPEPDYKTTSQMSDEEKGEYVTREFKAEIGHIKDNHFYNNRNDLEFEEFVEPNIPPVIVDPENNCIGYQPSPKA